MNNNRRVSGILSFCVVLMAVCFFPLHSVGAQTQPEPQAQEADPQESVPGESLPGESQDSLTRDAPPPQDQLRAFDDDVMTRFRKPMPELQLLPPEEFDAVTTLYEGVPYNDSMLAYKVRVPNDWEKAPEQGSSNFLLSNKLYSELAVFHGPPSILGRSHLQINAVNLEYQLTAEEWFLIHILEEGYTTEGMVVHSKDKVEALLIIMDGDVSYVVRTMAFINGKRAIYAEYYVPLVLWNEERSMQEQVMASLEIVNPKEEIVENLLAFQFLDIADIKYPESWEVRAKPLRSVERMSTKIVNIRETADKVGRVQGETQGQVDATLVASAAAESLIKEIENYKKSLEGTGMLVGDKIESIDGLSYNENVDFGFTEAYKGIDSTSDFIDYELWFTVMVAGNYYYFITLLTPARNETFAVWARNIESYKIMVESAEPSLVGFMDTDGGL